MEWNILSIIRQTQRRDGMSYLTRPSVFSRTVCLQPVTPNRPNWSFVSQIWEIYSCWPFDRMEARKPGYGSGAPSCLKYQHVFISCQKQGPEADFGDLACFAARNGSKGRTDS